MRISLDLILLGTPPYRIPTCFRKDISLLIEETVRREAPGLHSFYWGDKMGGGIMPFAFSLIIPGPRLIEQDNGKFLECISNTLRLCISSSDFNLLNHLYNGLLKYIGEYSLFNYSIKFRNFYFQKMRMINEERAKFKIISPVVVRRIENGEEKGYMTWEDDDYVEMLIDSVETLCIHFIRSDYSLSDKDIEIIPSLCSTARIGHFSGFIPATKGIIEIKAPVEVLRLIYDVGLGVKGCQGFGMVDIVG